MARKWTIYYGGPNGGVKMAIRITMNSRGVLLFNRRAWEAFGKPAAAELMFDEEENVIGLKPRDLRYQNAFPFKTTKGARREKYGYHFVYTAAFCKHFDIRPKSTILFTKPDMENDGTLLLDLNTAVNVGRGSR